MQKPKSILKPENIAIADNHDLSELLYGTVKIVSQSQTKIYHYINTKRKVKTIEGLLKVHDTSMHRFAPDIVKRIKMRHAKVLRKKESLYRKRPSPRSGNKKRNPIS